MGRKARPKPEKLGEKLLQIRQSLGLSQSQMYKQLELEDFVSHKQMSKYELGITEPPLMILLRYARVVGISTDVLIDDEMDLPVKLPAKPKRSYI